MSDVIQIYNISWQTIPQEAWSQILSELSIGSYVATLPYKVPNGYMTWKIPMLIELKATCVDESDESMDITLPLVIEYRRELIQTQLLEREFVWRRIT